MSTTSRAVELVTELHERGEKPTADALLPHFPGKERNQICTALESAAHRGLIHRSGTTPRPGQYRTSPVYAQGPRQIATGVKVASVWEWAQTFAEPAPQEYVIPVFGKEP